MKSKEHSGTRKNTQIFTARGRGSGWEELGIFPSPLERNLVFSAFVKINTVFLHSYSPCYFHGKFRGLFRPERRDTLSTEYRGVVCCLGASYQVEMTAYSVGLANSSHGGVC